MTADFISFHAAEFRYREQLNAKARTPGSVVNNWPIVNANVSATESCAEKRGGEKIVSWLAMRADLTS